MILIAYLFESFFQIIVLLVVFPTLTSKIHDGKILTTSQVLLILLYEKIFKGRFGGRIWFKHCILLYIITLPYLPLPHKVRKAIVIR